jgi:hypothetical protein
MNGLIKSSMLSLVAASALLAAPPARSQADEAYGDDYGSGDYARVMYLDNGLTVRRAVSDPSAPLEEQVGVNAPIFPGDTLLTGVDERVEVQLSGGTLVRVDRHTELILLALPAPSATIVDNTVLQLAEGAIRLAASVTSDEEFRIDTPAGSIYLLGDGDFRIEVDPDGTTRLISRRGVAELSSQGGSVLVRGGMLSEVYPGSVPSTPDPYNTFTADGFDRWVSQRDDAYREQDRYAGGYDDEVYQDLPYEVQPYYRELGSHGSWVYSSDYGYVWYPADVAPSWRPYRYGHWSYGPRGYFWVGSEPWGWAPYHYGRWSWIGPYGWCWIPGRVFAGAWVAWSWGSLYVGWGPLNYWNQPAYIGAVHYGYYDYNCWTFVRYGHLHHRRYDHHAVSGHHVGDDLKHSAIVTRPPRVAPTRLADSRDAAEEAFRSARGDARARMRPVDPGRRPADDMVGLERRISRLGVDRAARVRPAGTSDGSRQTPPATPSGSSPRGAPSRVLTGRSRALATERQHADRGPTGPEAIRPTGPRRTEANQPATPKRVETGRPTGPRRTEASRPATPKRTEPSRTTTGPRSKASSSSPPPKSRYSDGQRTNQRLRTLYEQMARPRTTRERASSPQPSRRPAKSSRAGSGTSSSRSSSRTNVRSAPSSRRGGKSAASPSGSGRSRPGSSATKGSSGRSSGSGRSRPGSSATKGSSGRSSGSSAKGSASSGRSGQKPSRGGGRSRGKKNQD